MSNIVHMPRHADDLDTMTLGKVLSQSGYFADARDAAQAVVKVLAGRELGFPPIASMRGIHIIKGQVALSANLIAAAIKRSKPAYNYRILEITADVCRIAFFEDGEEVGISTFTRAEAKAAGTQNLEKFARNMLFARAMTNGARWYCAGIFGGPIYTPEELGAPVDGEGDVIDLPHATPEPEPLRAQPPVARVLTKTNGTQPLDRKAAIQKIEMMWRKEASYGGNLAQQKTEQQIPIEDVEAFSDDELVELGLAIKARLQDAAANAELVETEAVEA